MRKFPNVNRVKIYLWGVIVLFGMINFSGVFCFAQVLPETSGEEEQVAAGKGARWQMQPSFVFYQQYSDNVDLRSESPVGAMRTEIIPSLTFIRPLPRKQMKVNLDFKLDYRNKDNGVSEALYWYNMYGYMGHELSPRTSYEVSSTLSLGYTENSVGTPFVNVFGGVSRNMFFNVVPAIRYNLTRNTLIKSSYEFAITSYSKETALDAYENILSFTVEQKVGSRIKFDGGGIYAIREFSNNTGYNELRVPFGLTFDMTYANVRLGGLYLMRSYDQDPGARADQQRQDVTRLGFNIGADLGGKLLRLKSTSVELIYSTNYYHDLQGYPYENQEARIALYHAFRKFDVYFYGRLGSNTYIDPRNEEISYVGLGGLWKWKINNLMDIEFRFDMDDFDYKPAGNTYTITRMTVDYSYRITDLWELGLTYRNTSSTSNNNSGNYDENLYAIYAKAVW